MAQIVNMCVPKDADSSTKSSKVPTSVEMLKLVFNTYMTKRSKR